MSIYSSLQELQVRKFTDNVDTHAAGRTGNHAHSGLQRKAVHVGHLALSDLADLIPRHLSHLVAVGLCGTFLHFRCFFELDGYGRLYVNSVVAAEPSALRRPYGDERLYVPIRAVAEAAGYSVSWDKEFGVTVKDGGEMVFQICPDTDLAHGPAAADRQSLSGPCLIANGVTYLEAGDLAHLLGMFYGG